MGFYHMTVIGILPAYGGARNVLEVGQDVKLVAYFKESGSVPCILGNICCCSVN